MALQQKPKHRLAGLSKLRHVVPFQMLKTVCEGIFGSIMVYCLPLIGGCTKAELHSIQVLQNKAAQLVTRQAPRTNRDYMYGKLDWLTVNQLIVYHSLLQVHRVRYSHEPEYMNQFLSKYSRTGRICIPKINLTLVMESFMYRGATLWNSLPSDIRRIEKIRCFKKEIRTWIKKNVPRFLV